MRWTRYAMLHAECAWHALTARLLLLLIVQTSDIRYHCCPVRLMCVSCYPPGLVMSIVSAQDDFISFQTKASKPGQGVAKKSSKAGGRILAIRP